MPTHQDPSGFHVTFGEAARVSKQKKPRKATSMNRRRNNRSAAKAPPEPDLHDTEATMRELTANPEPASEPSGRREKQFVLFMTPRESRVWDALSKTFKASAGGDLRVPIPKSESDKRKNWQIPEHLFQDDELDGMVRHFADSGLIARIGDSGNGHDVYRMVRHPEQYHVIPIEKRTVMRISDAWIDAVRATQNIPAEVLNTRPFSPAFKLWFDDTNKQVRSSTAQVYLVNYRAYKNTGWGILVRNPDDRGEALPAYRYLVALPGFEAYRFVSKHSPAPEPVSDSNADQEHGAEPVRPDAGADGDIAAEEYPPRTVRLPSSKPAAPKNPFADQKLDELERTVADLQSESSRLELALDAKLKELVLAKQALRDRLREAMKDMEAQRARLASMLEKL